MAELTEQQIENVARRLRQINCEWAASTGRELDTWDEISDEKREGYRYAARALAPALALPRVVSHPDYDLVVETAATSTRCAMVNLTDWDVHVAAVEAITGEP